MEFGQLLEARVGYFGMIQAKYFELIEFGQLLEACVGYFGAQ